MNRIFLFIFSLIIICYSCQNESGKEIDSKRTSTIPFKKITPISYIFNEVNNNFSSLFDTIKLIKLKTSDEGLIGQISNVFFHKDKLIIIDKFKSKTIFVFNLNGEFLYKIGFNGKGPGEYLSINSVTIYDDIIAVLDWMTWKVIFYNTEGKFLQEKKIKPCPANILMLNQETFVFYYFNREVNKYKVTIVDSTFKVKEKLFPFQDKRNVIISNSPFQKVNDTSFTYTTSLCDTIFLISPKEVIAKYYLKINEYNDIHRFKEDNQKLKDRDFYQKLYKTNISRIISFMDLPEHLFIQYTKGDCAYISIISKETNISSTIQLGCLSKINDFFNFEIYGYNKNFLISSVDQYSYSKFPKEIKAFFNKTLSEEDLKKLQGNSLAENPIICLFQLKN